MNPFLLPALIHGLSSKHGFRYHLPGPLKNVILNWTIFLSKSYHACPVASCSSDSWKCTSIVPSLWRTGWSYRTIDVYPLDLFGKVLHVRITFELDKASHLVVFSFRQYGFRSFLSKVIAERICWAVAYDIFWFLTGIDILAFPPSRQVMVFLTVSLIWFEHSSQTTKGKLTCTDTSLDHFALIAGVSTGSILGPIVWNCRFQIRYLCWWHNYVQ